MVTPQGEATDRIAGMPRQAGVYHIYLALQSVAATRFSASLAGRLVFHPGFDRRGAELAVATTIAGGAFLGTDDEPQALKTAVRSGACDFMVNTLEEALRVLKNEVRKKTPLSAGLLGDAEEVLAAMVARGVQPDLIAAPEADAGERSAGMAAAWEELVRRGAKTISLPDDAAVPGEMSWTALRPQEMRRMDSIALTVIPEQDAVRRRWLEQAPGYFYREHPLERVFSGTAEERERLAAALAAEAGLSGATVRWNNERGERQDLSL
jgi:urocanate hydratase